MIEDTLVATVRAGGIQTAHLGVKKRGCLAGAGFAFNAAVRESGGLAGRDRSTVVFIVAPNRLTVVVSVDAVAFTAFRHFRIARGRCKDKKKSNEIKP